MKNRLGSYKKKLISEDIIKNNFSYFKNNFFLLKSSTNLIPYEIATSYFILFLKALHPHNWLQKKSQVKNNVTESNRILLNYLPQTFELNHFEQEKLKFVSTLDFFENFNFKGIPLSVNRAFINWIFNPRQIELLYYIPSAVEILELQANKKRCLTLLDVNYHNPPFKNNQRDPLSFLIHDMDHADHFFRYPELIKGQMGFYQMMKKAYNYPLLQKTIATNPVFKKEFEYIASDMNGYVIHLMKCLKSVFNQLDKNNKNDTSSSFLSLMHFWEMDEETYLSTQKLNTNKYTQSDEDLIVRFFESRTECILNSS